MTQTPLYQTTLSAKARRGLVLNAIGASVLVLLSGSQWYAGGHWLQAVIFCIMAPVLVLIVLIWLRSKHPLEIFADRIVLNSIFSTSVPLAHIGGIGTHPKRGSPSLSYRDANRGQSGEMLIHWRFIREPQDEVIARIKSALVEAAS